MGLCSCLATQAGLRVDSSCGRNSGLRKSTSVSESILKGLDRKGSSLDVNHVDLETRSNEATWRKQSSWGPQLEFFFLSSYFLPSNLSSSDMDREDFVQTSPCLLCECSDILANAQGACACGHSTQVHRLNDGYLIGPRACRTGNTVFLAPNGITHAATPLDAGNIICVRCEETYYLHRIRQPTSSQGPQSTHRMSSTPPTIPAWVRPGTFSNANHPTVNQGRMQAAERHRSPPSQMPAQTRGVSVNPLVSFPTVRIAATMSSVAPMTTAAIQPVRRPRQRQHRQQLLQPGPSLPRTNSFDINLLIIIHPEPYYGYYAPGNVFVDPKDIRVASNIQTNKPARLVRRADSLGLMFTLRQRVHANTPIVDDFTASFLAHMQAKNLSFNDTPLLNSGPSSSPPIVSSQPCWRLLYHKQVERTASQFPKCFITEQPTTSVTYANVLKIATKFPTIEMDGVLHNLLFIVPASNVIVGPLNDQGHHFCLAERLWFRLQTPLQSEDADPSDIECASFCSGSSARNQSPPLVSSASASRTLLGSHVAIPTLASSSHVEAGTDLDTDLHIPAAATNHSTSNSEDPQVTYTMLREILEQVQIHVDFDSQLVVSAESIVSAADILYDALYGFYFNMPHPLLPHGTSVSNVNSAALNAPDCRIFVGDAVGRGPAQAVWAQLIKKIVSNAQHWVTTLTDNYFTPLDLLAMAITADDQRDFEFYGFIIRQTLLWNFDLIPISPFLLALVLDGQLDFALSDKFIGHVAENAAKRLMTWPPTRPGQTELNLVYGCDPLNLLAECDLLSAFPLIRIRALSSSQLESLKPVIKKKFIFQVTSTESGAINILNQAHSLNMALRRGFFAEGKELLDISRVFNPDILNLEDVITSLYQGRKIRCPKQVLERIAYHSIARDHDLSMDYSHLEVRWKYLFARYIEGKGHVQSDTLDVATPLPEDIDPVVFRSFLFVQAVSGSPYMPSLDSEDFLKITFVPRLTNSIAYFSGAHFHTCFKSVDILLDEDIGHDILDINNEITAETQNKFDRWLHALVLQPPNFNDV